MITGAYMDENNAVIGTKDVSILIQLVNYKISRTAKDSKIPKYILNTFDRY